MNTSNDECYNLIIQIMKEKVKRTIDKLSKREDITNVRKTYFKIKFFPNRIWGDIKSNLLQQNITYNLVGNIETNEEMILIENPRFLLFYLIIK